MVTMFKICTDIYFGLCWTNWSAKVSITDEIFALLWWFDYNDHWSLIRVCLRRGRVLRVQSLETRNSSSSSLPPSLPLICFFHDFHTFVKKNCRCNLCTFSATDGQTSPFLELVRYKLYIIFHPGVHCWRLQQRNKWLWRGHNHPGLTIQVSMHDPVQHNWVKNGLRMIKFLDIW